MSRIGRKPVQVPDGVKLQISDHTITVEGPLGKLQWEHRPEVEVVYDPESRTVTVSRQNDQRLSRALHPAKSCVESVLRSTTLSPSR